MSARVHSRGSFSIMWPGDRSWPGGGLRNDCPIPMPPWSEKSSWPHDPCRPSAARSWDRFDTPNLAYAFWRWLDTVRAER